MEMIQFHMETFQFSFEKLTVWQESRKLVVHLYKITQQFPSEEKYGLVSQIRRSAVSVCANITEGTTRLSAKEQAHFTTVAFSSLMELFNHIIIANDLGYLTTEELVLIRKGIRNLSVKLSNLKNSQLNRIN
jgi:four helix bundle protein